MPTFLRVFITYGCWILSKAFPACMRLIILFLFFSFLHVVGWSYWFANIEEFLHPWDKSHLIIVYDPFTVVLNLVCLYFVEGFCVCVHQWFSFFWWYLCLVLVSGWWWPHRMSLGVLFPLQFFETVSEIQMLILLWMFDRISLWRHLVLDFLFVWSF